LHPKRKPLQAAKSPQSAFFLMLSRQQGRYVERMDCALAGRAQLLFASTRQFNIAMSDIHSAAVLLMTLPEDAAGELMSKLDAKQVEQVSIEIARTRSIAAEEQEQIIKQFTEANPSLGGLGGGIELAKSLIQKALGTGATAALSNLRQSIEAVPFGFLRNVDSQNLLTYIIDEHPQTIALIMSHLPPSFGAEILAGLPESRRLSVVRRIATMGRTNPDIIREIEKGLERRMSSVMSQSFENAGGVEAVAEMLNVSDRATERALMDSLGAEDAELVDEIRRLMFVFEDISRFADKDIQTVLKNVETSQWAMALKGASEALKEKILKNMSERAAETLREEMEYLGPAKRSVVEAKQQEIVDVIRKLEDSGEIDLNAINEEEELVQ
jgi:flagellar motor switch protein FliG